MTFLSCFRWKPKKRRARIITAPEVINERTDEDCGEESIGNVPEPGVPERVIPEQVAPELPTVDKGKGIAAGDDDSRTVNISDSDHEVINWSEVSSDSDRSGPSSYHPRLSRRARPPPTRLPPCQETAETASDDCHPPPPSSPSPNNLADDYQLHGYYPTENYYPQPVYKLPVASLYPENEPPAYYQTYPPCHHQEPEPEMSDTEKLAHRITKAIFGPVNPYHPGCSHPMPC